MYKALVNTTQLLQLMATCDYIQCVLNTISVTSAVLHSSCSLTDLYIYILEAVPPIHVVSNHVDTDKLTTANSGTFMSSSASLSSQSR